MSSHQVSYARKRRSTRVDQAIPLVVQGVGAMREPYQEQVSTQSVSCHGCSYLSKHEVIQGEVVYLDIKPATDGSVAYSSKARVKWVHKTGAKERIFQIAVELEIAGNIWGVTAPPVDWFLPRASDGPQATTGPQITSGMDATAAGRELKVVTRKEQAALPVQDLVSDAVSKLQMNNDVAASPIGPLAQMMVGFGEQIQAMASELAVAALVKEKGRLLQEFRGQLREEAIISIQSAIAASKESIAGQALKELNEAAEAGARESQAQWRKKIEKDMESARQHLQTQEREANERLEAMAVSTIERVQSKIETTRSEALERFVSRIREQVTPMLEIARDSLQKLQGSETALRKESESIFAGLEEQMAHSTNESLKKAQQDLETNTAAATAKANEILIKLYQSFEKSAKDHAVSLLASTENQMSEILREKAGEISQDFSTGIENYTRDYLESVGKSIAEIPQTVSSHSRR